jgi:propionyl-CoA carboxylase alpha chain
MGECAVAVAKSCNYYGAGTVEFIVDEDLSFYFLEMNTRLQVEHPVTELITGVDLVKEMIHVAEGKALSINQETLKIQGHAVEVRVCAEDPLNNFLPDVGRLQSYKRPQGNGVRVDDGIEEGMDIPIYYDPMIAKLITYGKDRTEAIEKMLRAIDEFKITGVATTLPFCKFALQHEAFLSGKFDTRFVSLYYNPEVLQEETNPIEAEIAAVLAAELYQNRKANTNNSANATTDKNAVNNWRKNRVVLR